MKNLCFTLFAALALLSCEEAINLDLPNSEPRLVIDALLGYSKADPDSTTIGEVRLTLTAPFLAESVPIAVGAQVEIIDETSQEAFVLGERVPGVFSENLPQLRPNRDYTLRVVYQNEEYKATEQLNGAAFIDSIEQGDGFLNDEEKETETIVTFTDIPNQRNYYLFSFGGDDFLVTDDEFYQNSQLTFSFFYEDLEPGDLAIITLIGIDADFARYADLALTQASGEAGSAFSVPAATVRGNIINATDAENFPFGYFALGEFDVTTLTIE
ncbi:DUF4249 family protein [Allomuricauda sp. d1]|uniref:DUF4249 family protein n=1 Tax=Allomuricauda sp. d1 TaxID=3136725 RepID=UPI0031D76316